MFRDSIEDFIEEVEKGIYTLDISDVDSFPKISILGGIEQLENNEQMEVANMAVGQKNIKIFCKKVSSVTLGQEVEIEKEGEGEFWKVTRYIDDAFLANTITAKFIADDVNKIQLTWVKKQGSEEAKFIAIWDNTKTHETTTEPRSAFINCEASAFTGVSPGECNTLNFDDLAAWKEARKQAVESSFTAATVPIKFSEYASTECNIDFKKVSTITDGKEVELSEGANIIESEESKDCTITFNYLAATTDSWTSADSMKTFLKDYVIVKKTGELSDGNLAKWEVKKSSEAASLAEGLKKPFCQPATADDIFGEHDEVKACEEVNSFTGLVWEKVLDNQGETPAKITEVAKVKVKLGESIPFDVTIKLQKAESEEVSYTSSDEILTVKYKNDFTAGDVPEKINELLTTVCAGFNDEQNNENTFTFAKCIDIDETYQDKSLSCESKLFWNAEDNLGSCNQPDGFFFNNDELPIFMRTQDLNDGEEIEWSSFFGTRTRRGVIVS